MRHQSTDGQPFGGVERNVLELRNLFDVDQCLGLIKPLLHQNRDMRAAGKNFGFAGMLLEHRAGLGHGRGFEIVKVLHTWFMKIASLESESHCLERYVFWSFEFISSFVL